MDADIRTAVCIEHEKLLKECPQALAELTSIWLEFSQQILAGESGTTSCGNGRRSMPRPIAIHETMPAIVRFVPSF